MREKEAWEHIAGELPPGWTITVEDGDPRAILRDPRGGLHSAIPPQWDNARGSQVDFAWAKFGISRRKYAELIAPQRVREAAEAVYGSYTFVHKHNENGHAFHVFAMRTDDIAQGAGLDICTAAWAAIVALKGGE